MINKIVVIISLLQFGISFSNTNTSKGIQSFLTVGPGASCNFDTTQGFTFQDALDTQNNEIRLVNSVVHIGTFSSQAGVYIRGGYNNCIDAIGDTQGSTPSVLDADSQGSVLTLGVDGSYIIETVKITNGLVVGSSPNNRGGGINLTALDMTVKLDHVIVENNTAFLGAGIYKSDDIGFPRNILLTIVDSIIQDNSTLVGGIGGGLYFEGLGEIIAYGDTLFTRNQAEFGGGTYIKNTSATFVVGPNSPTGSGFIANKANQNGAGIYSDSSTLDISGGIKNIPGIGMVGVSGKNYVLIENIADSDDNQTGIGGGLFLYNNSTVSMQAVSHISNHAHEGGAIYLYQGTELNVGFPENSQCQITNLNACNFFINNTASNAGGAIYAITNTLSNLKSVNFNGNRANEATVLSLNGSSTLNIESAVMYNNGDFGSNGYTDKYSLGTFSSSTLNIEHTTAVKNKNINSFILAISGGNLLNSYNNYFFNPQSGPWLEVMGAQSSVVDYGCQIVDGSNNVNDITHNIVTTTINSNDNLFFVDEANKDFHLTNNSLLVDYVGINCLTNSNLINNNKDIDNQPRTIWADLGADENLFNDIIYKNGFDFLINY